MSRWHSLKFDFTRDPPEPIWLVEDLIEKKAVTMLAADSGAGKSKLSWALTTAVLHGEHWLGRKTSGRRVMVLDNENTGNLVERNMRFMGVREADMDNLVYYCRQGILLGDPNDLEEIREECVEFNPDLIVIDTATAVSGINISDNVGVTQFYVLALRVLAEMGSAVLLLHHERKTQPGQDDDRKNAVLGAMQWRGQADAMLSLVGSDGIEKDVLPDGGMRKTFSTDLHVVKVREGDQGAKMTVHIQSEHSPDGKMKLMRIESPEQARKASFMMRVELVIADANGSMPRGDLAAAFGVNKDDPRFSRGISAMLAQGRLKLVGDVLYLA